MASDKSGENDLTLPFELLEYTFHQETHTQLNTGRERKYTHVVIKRVAQNSGKGSHQIELLSKTIGKMDEVSSDFFLIDDNTHLVNHDNLVKCTIENVTHHFKLKTAQDALRFITTANNVAIAACVTQETKGECVTTVASVQAKEEKSVSNFDHSELAFQDSSEAHTSNQTSQVISKSGIVVTPCLTSSVTTSLQTSGANNDANLSLDNESMNPVHDTSDSNLPDGSVPPNTKPQEVNDDNNDDDNVDAQSDEQCREESQSPVPKPPPVPNHSSKKPHPITLETVPSQASDEPEQVMEYPSAPSAGSERSISRSGAACYLNVSHGVDMGSEIFDINKRPSHYEAMRSCYNKALQPEWCRLSSRSSKTHQLIAALICDHPKRTPYTAVLSTGAHHNEIQKCGSTSTCDGHALSIIYEVAPKYFMQEMKNLQQDTESIFEYASPSSLDATHIFRLKPGIKFHLMMTGPPCGFIKEQEKPCMEWKTPFVEFPHIPTCSARILIGATMGIQGFVSHLLEDPILIDSVTILCAKNKEHQTVNFGNEFPRVEVMEYDPSDFLYNFRDVNVVKLKRIASNQENCESGYQESSDQNETAKSIRKHTRESSLTLASPNRNTPPPFLAFDPRKLEETVYSGLSIKNREIVKPFDVTSDVTIFKKQQAKQKYHDLIEKLKPKKALKELLSKLEDKIEENSKDLQSLAQLLSSKLEEMRHCLDTETLNEQMWSHTVKDYIQINVDHYHEVGKKKILNQNMVACVKQLLDDENAEVIVDCSWHDYLKDVPSSYQISDH